MGQGTEHRAAVERVVRDHAGWVFATARRRVRDAALAEDVAQAVFLLYWRKGAGIGSDGKLTSWLYRAVRYCSANALRLKDIRERHEREAAMERKEAQPAEWGEVEPELEGAMDRLSEKDRQAIVLRFYRGLSLRQVGEAVGIGEEAARKRVDRAVEKLGQNLAARGVAAQSLSLSALILAHAAEGGPVGLVDKVMVGIGSGVGTGRAGGIAQGAAKMMVLTRAKALGVLIVVSAIAGAVIAQVLPSSKPIIGQAGTGPAAAQPNRAAVDKGAGMVRELSLRSVVSQAAQPPGQTAAQPAADGKVTREIRLAVECGRKFDVTVTANGEVWRLSGVLSAGQDPEQWYRPTVRMSLTTASGVEEVTTNVMVQHGKDVVLSGQTGVGQSQQWLLRVDTPHPDGDGK